MDMEANQIDRISSLPEQLIYYILSFLDMKQVVQISAVSSRWGRLWTSTPYLNFNENSWEKSWCVATKKISGTTKKTGRRYRFKELIERVLLNRDASNILRLSLSASSYAGNMTLFEIDRWISYALQRCLHTLILDGYCIPLPKCLCFASNVKVVELVGAFLLSQNHGELTLNLKVVETLVIQKCNHDMGDMKMLNIYAPKLNCLRIAYVLYNIDCTLKVCAPNLKLFSHKGKMYKNYFFEKPSSADVIIIYMRAGDPLDKVMNMFLREFVHVDSLILSPNYLQFFSKSRNMLEDAQDEAFHNIKHLELVVWYKKSLIKPVVTYLQGLRGLETLVFKKSEGMSDLTSAEENYWDGLRQYLFNCRFHRLKSIEYQLIDITSTTPSNSQKKKLVKFCRKLQSIPIASSSVTIKLSLPMRARGPYILVLQTTSPFSISRNP